MNFDLKNLSQWLKANKLSLNVTKKISPNFSIFHSSSKKTDTSFEIILVGKRLIQTDAVSSKMIAYYGQNKEAMLQIN